MTKQTDNLEIVKQTRNIAADALYTVLEKVLKTNQKVSEAAFRDAWLAEMRKNKTIFQDGWYTPPPHGMIVLFGSDTNVSRLNYDSARPENTWPKDNIFLDYRKGLIYCYASPIDKETGNIGDFGMTIYFGKDKKITALLKTQLTVEKEIFNFAQVGKKISEVAKFALQLLQENNLKNQITSITDQTKTNIGHTFPPTDKPWTKKELSLLQTNELHKIAETISKRRIFFNEHEQTSIAKGLALTIEPRTVIASKPNILAPLSYHVVALFSNSTSKELLTNFDKIFKLTNMDYMIEEKENKKQQSQKITYSDVGDNYDTKDPIKIHAQRAARDTGNNLLQHGFREFSDSRGESAYVWKQKNQLMASVIEGLGTKNLIADGFRKAAGKSNYDVIAHDTVATIINDLVTVGATPLVIHAYWAIEDNEWLADEERMRDLIDGWKSACDIAGVSWGGGETATMKQIVQPNTCELGGSAFGVIKSKKRLLTDNKIKNNDRILFIKSNGVNANGISLTRAIANRLPKGYATKMKDGTMYGDALLTKSNIYAHVINDLLDAKVDLHYASNITGHGMRKVMRARQNFTYHIEKVFEPQEVFWFIGENAGLSEYELYDTYNMGQDYALFLPAKDVKKAQQIIRKNKFESLDAGYVKKGERKVIIEPKNIVFEGERLQVRI